MNLFSIRIRFNKKNLFEKKSNNRLFDVFRAENRIHASDMVNDSSSSGNSSETASSCEIIRIKNSINENPIPYLKQKVFLAAIRSEDFSDIIDETCKKTKHWQRANIK